MTALARGFRLALAALLPVAFAACASAPPAAPPAPRVFALAEVDTPPRMLNTADVTRWMTRGVPRLTVEARGTPTLVTLAVVVDDRGKVASASVVSQTSEEEGNAIRALARRMRFSPAVRRGRPVTVRLEIPVRFEVLCCAAERPGG